MCDPVSAGLLAGGLMGGGSLLAGASTGAAIFAGVTGAATVYSGIQSANSGLEAAYSRAESAWESSEEMMKKVQIIEDQALVEEVARRDQFDYFTSKNLASAAATGASINSESFEAIRKRNERTFNIDENIADVNEANAKGQAAQQAQQYSRAGFAEISGGKAAYKNSLLSTGLNLLTNAPMMDFSSIGLLNTSYNSVGGAPRTTSTRPQLRTF